MKRLVKWLVVFGIICCLLGTGIITAGVMMGGLKELNMRQMHTVVWPEDAYVQPEEDGC